MGHPQPPSPLVFSYKGIIPDAELMSWAREGMLGGIVIFRDNTVNETALRRGIEAVQEAAPRPLRTMLDEEGGRVRRLLDSPVSMPDLRTMKDGGPEAVANAYARVARRLQTLGIDTLLAPVADVGAPGAEWLNSRTYSDDPHEVASMVHHAVGAIQSQGIASCAKHFPGSGSVRHDPHLGTARDETSRTRWDLHDAIPFRAAVATGVEMIMVGHQESAAFDDCRPADLSANVIRRVLREGLGFGGLVLSDDLSMGAIARAFPIEVSLNAALDAGCDLVVVCNDRVTQRRALSAWRVRPRTEAGAPLSA